MATPYRKLNFMANASSCAALCLQTAKCQSFDFSTTEQLCFLHWVYKNATTFLHREGDFEHYDRTGTGHSSKLPPYWLQLQHNVSYYVSAIIRNGFGHAAIVSSFPVKTDFTPPLPGPLLHVSSDNLLSNTNCTAALSQKCVLQTTLPNYRYAAVFLVC